jgi:trimeric autotransporter adhesin
MTTNTTGVYNVALGWQALKLNTAGSTNTALGAFALLNNETAASNVAVGTSAMQYNTSGTLNTAVGDSALLNNTTASNNTAVGKDALLANTAQAGNTGVGWNALGGCTTGLGRNVGVGYAGGSSITTGIANTHVGWSAGGQTTGSGNTTVGYITNPGTAAAAERIVIGYAFSGTADNRVHLGNNVSHIYNDFNSNATWTHSSDERSKKDIESSALGLDFIKELKPVTYKFKAPSEYPNEWESYDANRTKPIDEGIQHGMIAQDVKKALNKVNEQNFAGWDVLPDGKQQISEAMFVFPLIKAMQELSTQVDELKQELLALKGE